MNNRSDPAVMNAVLPDSHFPSGIDLDSALVLTKSPSPLSEFLGDEEATSTCPLLTPSPPMIYSHPLAVDVPSGVAYERQISPSSTDLELSSLPKLNGSAIHGYSGLNSNEHNNNRTIKDGQSVFVCENGIPSVMESSSSSSSVLQEQTVCAQLLSSHLYQHLTKSSDIDSFTSQENGKPPLSGLQLAVHKSPEDFYLLTWNWPLIRRLSFWSYMSLLIGCICVVVAMLAKLPAVCNPSHGWWQGTLFYEVFPASFQDSNNDGIGDFYGIALRAKYLQSLGVRAVRLNSIFPSSHYPENYDSAINLTNIDVSLGTIKDFEFALATLHKNNISVLLDLPIYPFVNHFAEQESINIKINSEMDSFNNSDVHESSIAAVENAVSQAIQFWLQKGVDGFYLKGLANLVHEPHFTLLLKEWRSIINRYSHLDEEKILMCSADILERVRPDEMHKLNAILTRMDLLDVRLDGWINGTSNLKDQVDSMLNGVLYAKPGYPWIHWHLGSVDMHRLATRLGTRNASMALIFFQMMLPGTPSIFYGDEIGLQDYTDANGELSDLSHLHQLVPMQWNLSGFTQPHILPWLSHAIAATMDKQDTVRRVAQLREASPSIYMNGVWKDRENMQNTEIRYIDGDLLVVERRYPRRNSYVLVSSLSEHTITRDLSVFYYGGEVVFDFQNRFGECLTFHSLTLYPGDVIIIKLDK